MRPWIDTAPFHALNVGAGNRVLDAVFPFLTSMHQQGWFMALACIGVAVALWRGTPRARVWILCALVAVGIADAGAAKGVKRLFPRERPCHRTASGATVVPDVRQAPGSDCPGSPSFPSNHAANMMALGTVCWWMTRRRSRWAPLWFLLPLIIGYTRIYLGYHYPSDVLGGWAMGAAVAALTIFAARRSPAVQAALRE